MPANLGSASYYLSVETQGLVTGLKQAESAAASSSGKIAASLAGIGGGGGLNQAAGQVAASSQKMAQSLNTVSTSAGHAAVSFRSLSSTFATLAGFGAIASGALIAHEALVKVASETQKLVQLQFQFNKMYGEGSAALLRFSKDLAASTGQSTATVTEGLGRFQVLVKGFGLSQAQMEKLSKVTLDLAAVMGISTVDAFERMLGAFRDGGESVEKLGLVMNDTTVKAFGAMTDAQRKQFEQLDAVTKSQIRYNEIIKQAAQFEGAAADRGNDAAGAFDKLGAATNNLAATFGGGLSSSSHGLVGGITGAVKAFDDFLQRSAEVQKAIADLEAAGKGTRIGSFVLRQDPKEIEQQIALNRERAKSEEEVGKAAQVAKDAQANALKEVGLAQQAYAAQAIKAAQEVAKANIAAANEQIQFVQRGFADAFKMLDEERQKEIDAIKETSDARVAAIEKDRDAYAKAGEVEVQRLGFERDAKIKAIDAATDAVNKGLKAEIDGIRDVTEEAIRQYEIQRDGKIKAVNDAAEVASRAVDAEVRERDHARTIEDRNLQDQTQAAKRAIDARHTAAVRGFEAEVKAANAAKEQIIRGLDDQAKAARASAAAQIRGLEEQAKKAQAAHDARIRSIEKQVQKAQQAHDATIRRIQDEQKAAEDAHTATVRGLDETERRAEADHEQTIRNIKDAADAADRAHDQELRAIDDLRRAEDDRHRRARNDLDDELHRRQDAIDQQLGAIDALEQAQRQGEARQRLQDQLSGAQTNLKKAESTGNLSEIQAAQRDVLAAERAIQQESVSEARDAARQKLQDAKDAIGDEITARKDAEDEQNRLRDEALAADKQASDDRLKLVKDDGDAKKQAADDDLARIKTGIDAEKQAADDRLTAIKDGLDKEKQAADDNLKAAQDRAAKQKQAADDALKSTLARIESQKQAVQDQLAKELESIASKKQAAEDANKAALEDIAGRKQAEADAHDAEIIAAQEVAEAAKEAIQDRRTAEDEATADRRRQIADERTAALEAIKAEYDDQATGIIPATQRAAEAAIKEKEARITANTEAKDAAIEATRLEYDGPDGKITKTKEAIAAVEEEAKQKILVIRAHEKEVLAAIKERYDAAQKLLEEAERREITALQDQVKAYQDMAKDSVTEVTKLQTAWDALTAAILKAKEAAAGGAKPGPTYGPPDPGATPKNPGSPPATDNGSGPKMPYGSTDGPVSNSSSREAKIARAKQIAIQRHLDPELYAAQIMQESNFEVSADSGQARGVAQFTPGTGKTYADKLGVTYEELVNSAELSLQAGAMHMEDLTREFGSQERALSAYFAGSGGGVRQDYVDAVRGRLPEVQGVPAQQSAPKSSGGPMVTYRDQWGNEYTVPEQDFNNRPGGNDDVTVTGRSASTQPMSDTQGAVPLWSSQELTSLQAPGSGRALADFRTTQQDWVQNAADANNICGPRLASLFADAVGRPPTPEEARALGREMGIYFGDPVAGGGRIESAAGFAGYATALIRQSNPGSTASVVQQSGVSNAQATDIASASLAGGAPITGFNTANHYFGATAFDPSSGKFNVGGTGTSLIGGSEWMSVAEMTALMGPLLGVLTLVDDAAQATGTSLKTLGDNSGVAATQTTDAFGNVTTSVTDAMGAVTTTVTDAAGNVTDQFTALTTTVPAAVEGMTGAVATDVQTMGDSILTSITDSSGNVTTTLTDMTGTVVDQFTTMADGTVVAMSDMAEGTTTQATTLADGVLTTVTDLAGNTVTTFTDMSGQVVGQSVAMADGTITSTGAMAEGVTTTVTDMSGTVTETFSDLLGNVTETTTDLQGTVTKIFTDASGTVTKTVTDLSGNVTKTITDMSGKVISSTTTMKSSVVGQYGEVGAGAKTMGEATTEAYGEVAKVPKINMGDTVSQLGKATEAANKYQKALVAAAKASEDLKGSPGGSKSGSGKNSGLGKAGGGSVKRMTAYMVGEGGTELFIPGEDGYILDAARTGKALNPDRMMGSLPKAMAMAGGGSGGASMSGGDVVIDLRGAQIYDGVKFEDRLVTALTTADRRGRLRFLRSV